MSGGSYTVTELVLPAELTWLQYLHSLYVKRAKVGKEHTVVDCDWLKIVYDSMPDKVKGTCPDYDFESQRVVWEECIKANLDKINILTLAKAHKCEWASDISIQHVKKKK